MSIKIGRALRAMIAFALALQIAGSFAATLADLDQHVRKYKNLNEFLSDEAGLREYRELLKSYFHYNDSFDEIFEKSIEQKRRMAKEIPGYADNYWHNVFPEELPIEIPSSKIARSGILTRPSQIETHIEKRTHVYQNNSSSLSNLPPDKQATHFQELQERVLISLAEIESKFDPQIKVTSATALSKLTREEHRQRQLYLTQKRSFFQNSVEAKELSNFLKWKIVESENWRDRYAQRFAEDSIRAVRELDSLNGEEALQITQEFNLAPEIRDDIAAVTQGFKAEVEKDFSHAQAVAKVVRVRTRPPFPQSVLSEYAKIRVDQPNATQAELNERLSASARLELHNFEKKASEIYEEKKEEVARLGSQGSAFELPIVDNPGEKDLIYQKQDSKLVRIVRISKIHAGFTGKSVSECVGGGDCQTLTPRRTALSDLSGVRTYAVERDNVFDGAVRLVPVREVGDSTKVYDSVDVMVNTIGSTQEIESKATGLKMRYGLFDAIVDELKPSEHSLGLVASEGRAISGNTALRDVQSRALSVVSARPLAAGTVLAPVDAALESEIVRLFPTAHYGYNPKGMIFESMRGNGEAFILVPRSQRPQISTNEIEKKLYRFIISRKMKGSPVYASLLEESAEWNLAVSHDVLLKRSASYLNTSSEAYRKAYAELFNEMLAKDSGSVEFRGQAEVRVHLVRELDAAIKAAAGDPVLSARLEEILEKRNGSPMWTAIRSFQSDEMGRNLVRAFAGPLRLSAMQSTLQLDASQMRTAGELFGHKDELQKSAREYLRLAKLGAPGTNIEKLASTLLTPEGSPVAEQLLASLDQGSAEDRADALYLREHMEVERRMGRKPQMHFAAVPTREAAHDAIMRSVLPMRVREPSTAPCQIFRVFAPPGQ